MAINLYRHIPFLKEVFKYALTAFGGPISHIGVMTKTFVDKRNDVSQAELTELFSFCQMLPGPSSTQTITLIGYKRGGVWLAVATLLVWILPATILMGALSFLVHYFNIKNIETNLFKYIQPMAVGFLTYASFKAMQLSIKNPATVGIMLVACLFTIVFKSPWTFPILIVLGGFISNISNKRIPDIVAKPKKINWNNLWLFASLFILAGALSETARVQHWHDARFYHLFENFYRFGTLVFGGGHALINVMYNQFITLPMARHTLPYMSSQEFLTGFGMVNCVPGPVFSICSYMGGMAMSSYGWQWQLGGCIIATIGVFLPSLLLILFFYPIYQNLKQHVIIFRALEGIHAVIVGIMFASGFILFNAMPFAWLSIAVIAITFGLLQFTKIPAPIIVLAWLVLGFVF